MPLPVVQPCPLGFCTPAGALCFLTGGHFQSFFLVGLPCLLGFCTPAGALCFLSGGHFQPLSSWGLALPSGFARRLGGLLPLRRAFSALLLVGLPCPLGFCTPAGRGLLPHRRAFSAPFPVGLGPSFGFCTPAGGVYFLTGGHSQPFSSWGSALPSDFARRLGRSASSPADIFSPSPRGARPFLRILHAGWSALLPLRQTFSALFLVGLGPSFGFCTPAGALCFLTGGHFQSIPISG